MKRQWLHTDRQTTDRQAVLPKESASHHFLICSQDNPGSKVLHVQVSVRCTDFNNTEVCRCGSAPSSQRPRASFGPGKCIWWGTATKWQFQVWGGLPTGALGSIWLSNCLWRPKGHSLLQQLPLPDNLCKNTVAYKESRNWYIKYIYFVCKEKKIYSIWWSQGHAASTTMHVYRLKVYKLVLQLCSYTTSLTYSLGFHKFSQLHSTRQS